MSLKDRIQEILDDIYGICDSENWSEIDRLTERIVEEIEKEAKKGKK